MSTARDITDIIGREEERFRATLSRGITMLEAALAAEPEQVDGDLAFALHDTYGFPLEVTQEIAGERGIDVDVDRFDVLMDDQRHRAKAAARRTDHYENLDSYQDVLERFGPTEFVGRQEIEAKATVLRHRAATPSSSTARPFYAEQGGQIGDTGWIATDTGKARIIDTTYALPGLHRHHIGHVDGEITPGQAAVAGIDAARRDEIRRNHTGTHVRALGHPPGARHQRQATGFAGCSRPAAVRLRSGRRRSPPEQLAGDRGPGQREILENHPVRAYETSREHADEIGAIAFFGEKYGDVVRVVEAGPHSTELCGGTHVRSLGDIGPLKIVSEQSIGANIRRIDAVTGFGTIERLRRDEDLLAHVAEVAQRAGGRGGRRRPPPGRRGQGAAVRAARRSARPGRPLPAPAIWPPRRSTGSSWPGSTGSARDELRDLALAVRQRDGVRAVVLGGAPEGGGAAIMSGGHARQRAARRRAHRRGGPAHPGRRRALAEFAQAGGQGPVPARRGARPGPQGASPDIVMRVLASTSGPGASASR